MVTQRKKSTTKAAEPVEAVPEQTAQESSESGAVLRIESGPAAASVGFSKRPDSPFEDGYDIDGEAVILAALIDADEPDPADPLYPRFEEYLERLKKLDLMREAHRARSNGNPEVPLNQAAKLRQIGALQSEEEDQMTVHTLEASRLYLGVSPEPGSGSRFGVPGARRAAAALRQLFLLTGSNNPYADWKLVEIDDKLAAIRILTTTIERSHMAMLDERKGRGMTYSILQSKAPQVFALGYHSPYGFAVTDVVAAFDYVVRVVKSATRRDVISKQQEHLALLRIKREIRSMFEHAIQAARVLMDKHLLQLNRTDYLPQALDESKKRVAAAVQLLGHVPTDVFTGERFPRHSLRNQKLTSKEVEMLKQLSITSQKEAAAEVDGASSVTGATVATVGLVD